MKKILYIITTSIAGLFLLSGCTDDVKYVEVKVTPVEHMFFPEDNYFLELRAGAGITQNFSWSAATAEDGYGVQYQILLLDAPNGNVLSTIDAGMETSLNVSHKEINRAMGKANIESGGTGAIYWTVTSSRGHNTSIASAAPRKMQVKRLLGLDYMPEYLYIAGTAIEGGKAVSEARQFRSTSDKAAGDEGEYEIYVKLNSGTFNMYDAKEGSNIRSWTVANGLLEEGSSEIQIPGEGVYRITLDFSVKLISYTKINEVAYSMVEDPTWNHVPLTYAGGGIWVLENWVGQFHDWGSWKDERYRFNVTTSDEAEVWGAKNATDSQPSNKTFSADNEYYWVAVYLKKNMSDNWDSKWKLHADYENLEGTLYLDMSGEAVNYRHYVIFK